MITETQALHVVIVVVAAAGLVHLVCLVFCMDALLFGVCLKDMVMTRHIYNKEKPLNYLRDATLELVEIIASLGHNKMFDNDGSSVVTALPFPFPSHQVLHQIHWTHQR
jgi:hypothetical protein